MYQHYYIPVFGITKMMKNKMNVYFGNPFEKKNNYNFQMCGNDHNSLINGFKPPS